MTQTKMQAIGMRHGLYFMTIKYKFESARDLTIAAIPESCQTFPVDRERILGILREHEPELKAAGLLHLRLFGSVARGDSTPASDVDLLADLDESRQIGLFAIVGIEHQLADLLGEEVHLSLSSSMRPRILDRVVKEAVPAF